MNAILDAAIPKCIGIIMDGNRRWAKKCGLPSIEGHRQGFETLKSCVSWAEEVGVENIIVYAFSTENLKRRPEEEVSYLMQLIRFAVEKQLADMQERGVRIRFLGQRESLPEDIQKHMRAIEDKSKNNTNLTLGIALSYGGRAEIVEAVKKLSVESLQNITEVNFSNYLWTNGMPDPDLIIRTGGAKRLSNFLPWQSVYSELYFTDTYWPAFSKEELMQALEQFASTKRNFGA